MHEKIKVQHLSRKAMLYIRQSSAYQVANNTESQRLQYGMRDRLEQLGWHQVEVIDEDLGQSAAGTVVRSIDMGSDNASDTVDIKTFWTLSDFELTTGGGNDFVTLYDLTAYGSADIRTGDERDTVTLDHVEVSDHLFADLGGGDDTLHAKFVEATSSDVRGGYGNDQFYTYWWLGADSNDWGNGSLNSFEYRYRRVL